MKKIILPVLLATVWISLSEFVRNEFLLKSYWTEHYQKLGLVFPAEPVNGAVWGIWSLCFAIAIFMIAQRFKLLQTAFLAWLTGFVMMWLVIGNLNVLPWGILPLAVPLSMLEAFLASYIIHRFSTSQP
ncbi:MAG: hypothetical protein U0U46_17055 [Saprospiraceae bacterium]|nr:hypothetical protein [Saprospiraceae bacterium]